jgi:hypothetical protein
LGPREEAGAVLILALVFLVSVAVIVGGLTAWTQNDLQNNLSFNATEANNSAATNAVDLAIQNIRYAPLLYGAGSTDLTLNASPPNYCWGSGPSQAFGMNVYCSTVWNPTESTTRQVTVSACPSFRTAPVIGTASWTAAQTSCPALPLLEAIVTYDDYPTFSGPDQAQCQVYCGTGMTINSWDWTPVIPTITNVAGLSGSTTNTNGGQPLTITGTGFTAGTTVNFVNVNPLAQLGDTPTQQIQQIVPANNVSFKSSTLITASSPPVTTLANYYVTVTVPGVGTSAPNASFEFDYTSVAPLIQTLTPTSGYTTHSVAITITGSGFINGAGVCMVEETLNNPVSPSTCSTYPATAVQVVSSTEITALTYPVQTLGEAFFIVVTTAGGASPNNPSAEFTFTLAPP